MIEIASSDTLWDAFYDGILEFCSDLAIFWVKLTPDSIKPGGGLYDANFIVRHNRVVTRLAYIWKPDGRVFRFPEDAHNAFLLTITCARRKWFLASAEWLQEVKELGYLDPDMLLKKDGTTQKMCTSLRFSLSSIYSNLN